MSPTSPPAAESATAREEAEIAAALGASPDAGYVASARESSMRTRDLMAEIASREPHAPRPAELERHERTFARWLLTATALACLAVLGALWWLDPISVTGRQTRFSVVENGGVRQAKLDLMDRLPAPPKVLVLGSSRSMKLDPAEIQNVSGQSAFNGAVSGGTTRDMYMYARYADELWGSSDEQYPHLVIGVVADVFRYTGTAALDPRLKKFLPAADRDSDPLNVTKQLLQVTTLKAGVRAVRRVVPRDGWSSLLHPEQGAGRIDAALATTGKQRGNRLENLDARGMQLFDPGAPGAKDPLTKRIEVQMRGFVRNSYTADPNYTGVDPRGLEMLRRTIKLANSHGDVPTIWVTPYAPGAIKYLPKEQYDARNRTYRAAIADLQDDPELRFSFVDTEDIATFGGVAHDFHDGIHMTEANTARLIAYLHEHGWLKRPARTS